MLTGLSGLLLSHYFAEQLLHVQFAGRLGEGSGPAAHAALSRWWSEGASQLGPASSLRAVWDVAAVPLAEHLGFEVSAIDRASGDTRCGLLTGADIRIGLLAGHWTTSLDRLWRETARSGIGLETAWFLCTNGRQVRLVDTQRTYSRAYIEFDLERAIENPSTFSVFWGVLRADAFRADRQEPGVLHQIIHAVARHGHAVNRSLRFGVIDAVQHLLAGLSRSGQRDAEALFDETLTIVYRALFLMFAEARGLVPTWHPLYRKSYTIESLRDRIERPGSVRGLWETFQAIARLAHRGCHAGTLVVPAFNGRLFSPARTPIAESCAVDDELARKALLGLSTTTVRSTRSRIDYRDLGVEQLGAVYESVLDYEPVVTEASHQVQLRRGGDRRKATGSFYTPQSLTDFLVRRTLHPLVEGASSDRIVGLRIVDPAMGSAAFLVSACRYLAGAYEGALLRENVCREADLSDSDRAVFRRQIAQRCLFGVDLNPTAVQLGRLSLWLATLSANKPLTFLDHRLVCGDSLLGASPTDIARQPPAPGAIHGSSHKSQVPLFADEDLEPTLARAVEQRRWMAETSDDTVEVVREKERRLHALGRGGLWKSIADLWCSCWMWPERETAPGPAVFASLADDLSHRHSALPRALAAALMNQSKDVARSRRFFHWVLEFPEIYVDDGGKPLANPGFDAVLGNPPWDMLRAGSGEKPFFRGSGIYRHQGGGHINRYQLFLERALMLSKRGGRIGLVLPSGFATDHTAAPLRRRLMTHASVDTISGFDNRKAIFPIHRSVHFMICTATAGEPTSRIACRFGIDDSTDLESMPDAPGIATGRADSITLTPALIRALTGDRLAIPELRCEADVRILEGIAHRVPRLGGEDGWGARFGRELNATDDRRHFHRGGRGLAVLEGKHIEPFRVHVDRAATHISQERASRLLDPAHTFMRRRLAYRDVASSTNRLSLIAAILPAGVVTTHSLFCLKTRLSIDNQVFLCGMLNSFVANYLIRQVMTTHLGSATVEALRVPRPRYDSTPFKEISDLSRTLSGRMSEEDYARLQARAASCYGLTADELAHVLSTFPLVDESTRAKTMDAFVRLP